MEIDKMLGMLNHNTLVSPPPHPYAHAYIILKMTLLHNSTTTYACALLNISNSSTTSHACAYVCTYTACMPLLYISYIVVWKISIFMYTHTHTHTYTHTCAHTTSLVGSLTEVLHPSCIDVLNVILFILKDNSQVCTIYSLMSSQCLVLAVITVSLLDCKMMKYPILHGMYMSYPFTCTSA